MRATHKFDYPPRYLRPNEQVRLNNIHQYIQRHLIYVIFVPWLINPILSLSDSRLLNPELRQNWQCKVFLIYFFVIYLNMLVRIYGDMVFVTEFTDPSVKQTEYMVSGEARLLQRWKNWPQSWRL